MHTMQQEYYAGRRGSRTSYRKQVHAAFSARMHAVDAKTAHVQTKAFYRSGGAEWTHGLD
jgi:hypothetical protein